MKKEEILAKSRAEKHDEGVEYVAGRGRYYGVTAMSAMFIVLIIFNLVQGRKNDMLFAMWWTYAGFEALGKCRAGNKAFIVAAIFGIAAGILNAITYILSVLG